MRFLEDFTILLPNLPGARCADPSIPAEIFFPDGREGLHAVLPMVEKLCNSCPSKVACLEYAVSQKIFDGIWAGTTGKQRRLMAKASTKGRNGKKVLPSKSKNTQQEDLSKRSTSSRSLQ